MQVVDDLTGDDQTGQCVVGCGDGCSLEEFEVLCGVSRRSVVGMAWGKVASALLGGFGGCGLIPQTVLNVKSGGRGRPPRVKEQAGWRGAKATPRARMPLLCS